MFVLLRIYELFCMTFYQFIDSKNLYIRIPLHLIFWLAYVFVFATLAKSAEYDISIFKIIEKHFYFILVDVFAVYFTVHLLLEKYLLNRKFLTFFILLIISIVATNFVTQLIRYYYYIPKYYPEYVFKVSLFKYNYFYNLVGTYAIVGLAAGIKLTKKWIKSQQEKAILMQQNAKSEMALLKSQLNPHFLFNTLNNIDSLIYVDQDKASDTVIKLSEILRYMLYESNENFVPFDKEINYLRSIIELHRLRFSQPEYISFICKGNTSGKKIPPMLFISFVENAIKHGVKTDKMPAIEIELHISDKEIYFYSKNKINQQKQKDKTGGIGLANVKKRLNILYPNKHSLDITNNNDWFEVKLTIFN